LREGEGYHSVTLNQETYSILNELSKNLKKSIPEIIHSVVTGRQFVHGILFDAQNVCLTCGRIVDYCAERNTDRCPFCDGGPVVTRYVKVETRGS